MRATPLALVALTSSLALAGCSTTPTGTGAGAATVPPVPTGAGSASTEPTPTASPAPTSAPAPTSTPSSQDDVAATVEAPQVDTDCGPYDDPQVLARVAGAPMLEALGEDPRLDGFVEALTGEVSPEVDLTGALAGGSFTVLAPVSAVFGDDAATTSFLLSYHLVPGEGLSPAELVAQGSQDSGLETLQGWGLTVFGEPGAPLLSEDSVPLLCGGVQTAGGTLHVVGQPLHPAGDYAVPGGAPAVPTTDAPPR